MLRQGTRYTGTDFLRFLCTFAIVYLHEIEAWKTYVTRLVEIGVPVFFMISGYFYSDTVRQGKTPVMLRKLLFLLVEACLVYLLWDFLLVYRRLGMDGFLPHYAGWLQYILQLHSVVCFIIMNQLPSPIPDHLWYLLAIIGVYLAVSFLNRILRKKNCIYLLIPILLLLKLFTIITWQEKMYIMRCFLYPGIPSFLMGDLIRKYQDKVQVSVSACSVMLALSCAFLLFARSLLPDRLVLQEILVTLVVHIGASFAILLSVQELPLYESSAVKKLAELGRTHSTNIYIFHYLISCELSMIVAKLSLQFPHLEQAYRYSSPFVVLIISLLLSSLIKKVGRTVRKTTALHKA